MEKKRVLCVLDAWTVIETPTKQGYVTPISGYKNRMTKSVSLQSGIAQVEREQKRATTEQSLAASTTTSDNSEVHKSHSDEELLSSHHSDKKIETGTCTNKTSDAKKLDTVASAQESGKDTLLSTQDQKQTETEKAAAQKPTVEKISRPQSLPISSWDEVSVEKCSGTLEERGIASGSSSPNVVEEGRSGNTSELSRDKASHGEWYSSIGNKSSEVEKTFSQAKSHLSSSQESIEA